MDELRDSVERWLGGAIGRAATLAPAPRIEHLGRVISVGDGIATVSGLPGTRAGALLEFGHGLVGIAHRLDPEEIGCILLGSEETLGSGDLVRGSDAVFSVPVGAGLLGRVIDPVGRPLDGGPPIEAERIEPIERDAPPIIDRDFVSEPLHTGVLVLDAMFPIGRGQRELLIGDRSTGKTSLAVDTLISQRDSDVACVYVAVGQRTSETRQVIEDVRTHGAGDRCLFVVAAADSPAGLQWVAPFAAMTMAEYFRDSGRHALVVIDDLTKHAAVHRELSLLLREPPGREAYPGDVFYLHSRLLERAAKMSRDRGGGSLTALPIAETQGGNLSAYIPTNLISITDGQIVLDGRLFNEGQKPAVDVGRSVSRVGGKAQLPALRAVAESLRLDYAQFLELEVFTRFGAMADERTARRVEHGKRIRAMLAQANSSPLSLAHQVAAVVALAVGDAIDRLPTDRIGEFRTRLGEWVQGAGAGLARRLDAGAPLAPEDHTALAAAAAAVLAGMQTTVTS